MQLLLTSIDHCNIIISTITPMLHTSKEVLTIPANAESITQYWISGTLKISNTRYLIFLKIVQYELDTDTDIMTTLIRTRPFRSCLVYSLGDQHMVPMLSPTYSTALFHNLPTLNTKTTPLKMNI